MSKLEYAKRAAAALAYLVLQQQDSVGLVTFDHEIRALVRPSSNPSHIKQLLHVMDQSPRPSGRRPPAPIFHDLAERFKKRGIVVRPQRPVRRRDAMLAGLKHFRHRRHEVILLHVLDPAELDFPFEQTTLFHGLEQLPDALVEPRALRAAYLAEFNRFVSHLRRACRMHQIDYVLARTDQPLDVAPFQFSGLAEMTSMPSRRRFLPSALPTRPCSVGWRRPLRRSSSTCGAGESAARCPGRQWPISWPPSTQRSGGSASSNGCSWPFAPL